MMVDDKFLAVNPGFMRVEDQFDALNGKEYTFITLDPKGGDKENIYSLDVTLVADIIQTSKRTHIFVGECQDPNGDDTFVAFADLNPCTPGQISPKCVVGYLEHLEDFRKLPLREKLALLEID